MSKSQITVFTVAPTSFGSAMHDDQSQLGLFLTQRQAIDAANKARAVLSSLGKRSNLVVTGGVKPEPIHRKRY